MNGEKLVLRLNTDACKGQENQVRYLEHTQAIITLNSTRRGDVTIKLTSPMGTKSLLLSSRPNDRDMKDGFQRWPFMTTHTWGEDPTGEWVLEVAMKDGSQETAFVSEWTLVLHGTQVAPYIDEARSKPKCERAVQKTEELEQEMEEELGLEEEPREVIPDDQIFQEMAGLVGDDDAEEEQLIGGGPEDTNLEDWYANNLGGYNEEDLDADDYYPTDDDWYKEQVYKYKLEQLKRRLENNYFY